MADIIFRRPADDLDSRYIREIVDYSFPGTSKKRVAAYRVDVKQYYCPVECLPI